LNTTRRIIILCDGDRCSSNQFAAEARHWMSVESFNSAIGIMPCVGYGFDDVLCCAGTNADDKLQAHVQVWYILKPIVRVIGRLRCRWRLRGSRRSMDELSRNVIIIDEYVFIEIQA
jgi:hypothetical protein